MKLIVKGYFDLQKAMGGNSPIVVEKAGGTIRDLLDCLTHRFGKDLSDLIFDPKTGEFFGHLMLLVNGRNYTAMPNGLDTMLKDGDEVALFPPIAGG